MLQFTMDIIFSKIRLSTFLLIIVAVSYFENKSFADACPTGYSTRGIYCYGPPPSGWDWTTPGGILIGLICPSGTKDSGTTCWYDRGAGRIPSKTACASGQRDDGTSCWEDLKCTTVDKGFSNLSWGSVGCNGPMRQPTYAPWWVGGFRSGWNDCYSTWIAKLSTTCTGCGCIKTQLFSRQFCAANEELVAGLCYPKALYGTKCTATHCSFSKDIRVASSYSSIFDKPATYSGPSLTQTDCTTGKEPICDKAYNNVTFLATHNGPSHLANPLLSWGPNGSNINDQDISWSDQLKMGVRATKSPVLISTDQGIVRAVLLPGMYTQGIATVCHGLAPGDLESMTPDILKYCGMVGSAGLTVCKQIMEGLKKDPCLLDRAARPLSTFLVETSDFLNTNPGAVVTIFFENQGVFDVMRSVIATTPSIQKYIYVNPPNARDWPTIRNLVSRNKRLILFSDPPGDYPENLFYTYFNRRGNSAWISRYDFKTSPKLKSDVFNHDEDNQSSAQSTQFWILQHFVTPLLSGSPTDASASNSPSTLWGRVSSYMGTIGKKPSFIWVDFANRPDTGLNSPANVVNMLNTKY
ncbi:MAG: hypothetical protein ABIQ95_01135 [Bdellovibrionia bacterium]